MKYPLFVTLAVLSIFSACSKKDDEPNVTEQLTAGRWANGREFNDSDLNGQFTEIPPEACNLDDGFTFHNDNRLLLDYGTLHCSPNDPTENETVTLQWRLEDNGQSLVMEFPFDEIKYHIVSIKQNELVLSEIDESTPGVYTERFILTR